MGECFPLVVKMVKWRMQAPPYKGSLQTHELSRIYRASGCGSRNCPLALWFICHLGGFSSCLHLHIDISAYHPLLYCVWGRCPLCKPLPSLVPLRHPPSLRAQQPTPPCQLWHSPRVLLRHLPCHKLQTVGSCSRCYLRLTIANILIFQI